LSCWSGYDVATSQQHSAIASEGREKGMAQRAIPFAVGGNGYYW
jgi:hypothetical protein